MNISCQLSLSLNESSVCSPVGLCKRVFCKDGVMIELQGYSSRYLQSNVEFRQIFLSK